VYIRTRPCLTVLDHVWFVLKLYWSYDDRLKTYVHSRGVDFMYGCIYRLIRSHTLCYGLRQPLIRLYTDMTSLPVLFLSFINHARLLQIQSNGPSVTQIRSRLVRWYMYVRFTHVANRVCSVWASHYTKGKSELNCQMYSAIVTQWVIAIDFKYFNYYFLQKGRFWFWVRVASRRLLGLGYVYVKNKK